MSDLEKPVSSVLDATAGYLKEGGGYDVAVAALFLAHSVPMPPSVIKRFRLGVGRLIDGSFDLLAGTIARTNARLNFDAKLQEGVVKVMANAGANDLAQNSPAISSAVAFSMMKEYGLKFDNKAAVARQAFEALANDPPLQDEAPEGNIDVDWLNYFSDIAAQKSTPEMQLLMGKILAGEIRKPGSFSPMTVNVLSTLTPPLAQKFEQLCSISTEVNGYSSILIGMFPQFLTKGIPEIGFTYLDLLALRSHQLLASETGSNFAFSPGDSCFMVNCGRNYLAVAAGSGGEKIVQVALFSQVGNEMRRLVTPKPVDWFNEKLSAIFAEPNWKLHFVDQ